jgi:hypothetical protein
VYGRHSYDQEKRSALDLLGKALGSDSREQRDANVHTFEARR